MITGIVNEHHEALIPLRVRNSQGREENILAVVDTGFNGSLSLPSELISKLELEFQRRGLAQLADGSEIIFNIYNGWVIWDELPRRVKIDEANTDPMIGMNLLSGFQLKIDVERGGAVTIQQLSKSSV